MREIKFRAWDDKKKVMLDSFYMFDDIFTSSGKLWYGIRDNLSSLIQYTGLKDKNGVEIYEGDICQDKHDNIYLIDFRKGGFEAVHSPDCRAEAEGECKWDDLGSIYDELEIIGNIYENKEFLK